MLTESARMSSATEARYRVQAPNSLPRTIKMVALDLNSRARFRAPLPIGSHRLRIAMSVNQAGVGYLAAFSREITICARLRESAAYANGSMNRGKRRNELR